MHNRSLTESEKEFSIVRGGPLYQFLLRAGLLKSPLGWLSRRITVAILVTWLPLAVMTALAGTFAGGVDVPFLSDLSNVRFLIAVPMLLAAEVIIHQRIRVMVAQFVKCDLIDSADRVRFDALIDWCMRLRNSGVAELVCLILSYTAGSMVWRSYGTLSVTTWYGTHVDGTMLFTPAGQWLSWISLPLARFLILRWYFRVSIWYLFLWQTSRFNLKLDPLHPDRAGGLGFLEGSMMAFAPVLTAQSIYFSAMIGNRIWHVGAKLPSFQLEILGFVLAMLVFVLLPLTFFTYQMVNAKFEASHAYSQLAGRYVRDFRKRWLSGNHPTDQELLGSADLQSLADLGNSFDVMDQMRLVPFSKTTVVKLTVLICFPLLPLVLTMVPLHELMTRLVQLLI